MRKELDDTFIQRFLQILAFFKLSQINTLNYILESFKFIDLGLNVACFAKSLLNILNAFTWGANWRYDVLFSETVTFFI